VSSHIVSFSRLFFPSRFFVVILVVPRSYTALFSGGTVHCKARGVLRWRRLHEIVRCHPPQVRPYECVTSLQHSATHRNALQHTAIHYMNCPMPSTSGASIWMIRIAYSCVTLQRTCNILQHIAHTHPLPSISGVSPSLQCPMNCNNTKSNCGPSSPTGVQVHK